MFIFPDTHSESCCYFSIFYLSVLHVFISCEISFRIRFMVTTMLIVFFSSFSANFPEVKKLSVVILRHFPREVFINFRMYSDKGRLECRWGSFPKQKNLFSKYYDEASIGSQNLTPNLSGSTSNSINTPKPNHGG